MRKKEGFAACQVHIPEELWNEAKSSVTEMSEELRNKGYKIFPKDVINTALRFMLAGNPNNNLDPEQQLNRINGVFSGLGAGGRSEKEVKSKKSCCEVSKKSKNREPQYIQGTLF